MSRQEQFLNVVDRDEAERRFRAAIRLTVIGEECVPLAEALGRVLAVEVRSPVDVPSFDRSNVDGFAVQASDTFGAREEEPCQMRLLDEVIATAVVPRCEVISGTAVAIATGGMIPRGADAVVMMEHADATETEIYLAQTRVSLSTPAEIGSFRSAQSIFVRRAVTPGTNVSFAGTDIATGETVLRRGDVLTSRETGVLAAIGVAEVLVWRRPRVAILSTGDEIIAPGTPMQPGLVFDSNARILADATREAGGQPVELGIVHDDEAQLRDVLRRTLADCDLVLLSGGTSKGAGDLCYRIVSELTDPGIVAHGVALKPGKPICLAASAGKAVVVLPGFPTSAIFTFHEFVAPVIRQLAGLPREQRNSVFARMAVKVNSEIGRTEYLLVGLVGSPPNLAAYPMGKGSGSVTTFSRADGFITIGRQEEIVESGARVDVQLLGRDLHVADLVVIGSHCVGLDFLMSRMQARGWYVKCLAVGSTAGLEAVRRGECDLAGMHLLDPQSNEYNRPFITTDMELIPGYGRRQGILFRRGDARFESRSADECLAAARRDPNCLMVNRHQGSGTRILIDQLLDGAKPRGYANQPRSHNAVAAAVRQGRADWGVAIELVARQAELGFVPLRDEQFDFVTPGERVAKPAVRAFLALLRDADVRRVLTELGFRLPAT